MEQGKCLIEKVVRTKEELKNPSMEFLSSRLVSLAFLLQLFYMRYIVYLESKNVRRESKVGFQWSRVMLENKRQETEVSIKGWYTSIQQCQFAQISRLVES